jgi:hypothetical protein
LLVAVAVGKLLIVPFAEKPRQGWRGFIDEWKRYHGTVTVTCVL